MKAQLLLWVSLLLASWTFGCGGRANDIAENRSSGGASSGGGPSSAGGPSACEAAAPGGGGSPLNGAREPKTHRPAQCCVAMRGSDSGSQPYPIDRAGVAPDGGVACVSDSQCDRGTNGRCDPFAGLVGPGGCSYDECSSDADCPGSTPCLCRTSPVDKSPNSCASPGNCVLDADCGAPGFCSPSRGACYSPSAYFCHTALDTCIDDADCPPLDGAPFSASNVCAYDGTARHWACSQLICLPP